MTALLSGPLPALADPAELVEWTRAPRPDQLAARDPATNTGLVEFEGRVRRRGFDRVRLRVKRDGRTLWLTSMPVERAAGSAFRLRDRLPAGPFAYDLAVELIRNDRATPVLVVEQVAVGDVILVNGGADAAAARQAGTAAGDRHPLVRSFGTRSRDPDRTLSDAAWRPAEGDAEEGPGAVGQWALRMGRQVLAQYRTPVGILSGAGPEPSPLDYLARPRRPDDPATNYGRLLSRARLAGVAESARLMIWYPDEGEHVDAETFDQAFRVLRDRWMRDFPALERILVIQTRPGCGRDPWDAALRERQRRWEETFDNVSVLSTTGVASHDGCRYAYTGGYASIGDHAARWWGRYGFGDDRDPAVEPPRPVRAFIPSVEGGEVVVECQSGAQRLHWTPGAEADFRLDGSTARVVGGRVDGARLRLTLDAGGFDAVGLTYAGHAGAGARVVNANGLGLVSFAGFPIELPLPAAPADLSARAATCQQVELAWGPAAGATSYRVERDGEPVGETTVPRFADVPLDPDREYVYRVSASNRGGDSPAAGPIRVRTPPVPGPPSPPAEVAARARSNSEIEVRWTPADNASSYLVQRNRAEPVVVYATSYLDQGLEPGTELAYRVAGANPGATSRYAEAASIKLTFENVFARVPESVDYRIVYDLRLPVDLVPDDPGHVGYDRVAPVDGPFDRVAYYLELQPRHSGAMHWVYVSMDAFTDRIEHVGVPTLASGARFQQPVSNLRVLASPETGLAEDRPPEPGWIEFWGRTYSTGNAAGVPGADPDRYDAGDEMNLAGVYGSMQVFRGTTAPSTVFAYNGWASPGVDDIGIGESPFEHPDWTFAANADAYVHRRLQVLVRPSGTGSPPTLTP